MTKYQQAKRIVREYFDAIENASYENVAEVLKAHTTEVIYGVVFIHSVNSKVHKRRPIFFGLH